MKVEITKKETSPTELPLGITPDELAKWKHLYGEVFFLRVKNEELPKDIIGAWVRLPSFDVMQLVQDASKKSEILGLYQLYINCKLRASDAIEGNIKYLLSIFSKLDILVKTYEIEVEKY